MHQDTFNFQGIFEEFSVEGDPEGQANDHNEDEAASIADSLSDTEEGANGEAEFQPEDDADGSFQAATAYEQAQLLLVSLLENFCALYDRNPDKNSRLFMAVCKQLLNVGVLTSEDLFKKSERLRGTYKKAFRDLVLNAIESIEEKSKGNLLTDGEGIGGSFQDSSGSSDSNLSEASQEDSVLGRSSNSGVFDLEPVRSRLETDYKNLEMIGKGGFATVHRGENRIDHCKYAFKKIEFTSRSSDTYQKIIREIKSLANLDHPNIVRYHGAWIEEKTSKVNLLTDASWDQFDTYTNDISEGTSFTKTPQNGIAIPISNDLTRFSFETPGYYMIIQMELCQFTLADWLEQRNFLITRGSPWSPELSARYSSRLKYLKPRIDPSTFASLLGPDQWTISPAENRRIFKCIVKALQHIHSKGIIHRDLKPANILFQFDNVFIPKIGDFGLASDTQAVHHTMAVEGKLGELVTSPSSCSSLNSKSTRTSGLGTCTYAAPEQIRESEYDEKVDIYSLGIILFELFHPFVTGMERIDILEDLRTRRIIPPNFMKTWPKEAAFIWSCISENAQSRPSAKQILESEILEHDLEDSIELLQRENAVLRALRAHDKKALSELHRKFSDFIREYSQGRDNIPRDHLLDLALQLESICIK